MLQKRTRALGLVLALLMGGSAAAEGYLEMIPVFWRGLYPNGGEGLYCGDRFAARDRSYNIEHVYPMSWVGKALRCGDRRQCRQRSALFNRIESDMHNMYPARKDLNKLRGSMSFAELRGERHVERGCDMEVDQKSRRVEPRPAVRGNIARAMLYLSDTYDLKIYERQRRMLERWHREDPVDEQERARNRRIAQIQGNSNPWIEP